MSAEVRDMIRNYEEAISLYDAQIPVVRGAELERLRTHRNWNLRIIAGLRAL
jgi:hypothetical protein